ncbi:MAG: NAD(P)/FAD-dependent oxidoreductase [Candidatus Eisenbacteria sp.]|nr:NAD(P)/FAD-dependent oxidoreductase [Candidatus Eisenbacteria bacterium]
MPQPDPAEVLVVGGGAAGSLAAIAAAEAGARVLLLEKMPRLGSKLLMSGKGRCNLTNRAPLDEFIAAFGETGSLLRNVFHRFFVDDLCRFFEAQDLSLKTERGGRVFPESGEAAAVVDVLMRELDRCGVMVRPASAVEAVLIQGGAVRGVALLRRDPVARGQGAPGARAAPAGAGGRAQEVQPTIPAPPTIPARAVVLATGGASYPQTGSSGDGYRIAEALGHRIIPPRPALVPLVLAEPIPREWRQVTLRHVRVTLLADGGTLDERFGEAFFVRDGIAGPAVLPLSRRAGAALEAGRRVEIILNLKPALSAEKLDARLQREFAAHGQPGSPWAILKQLLPLKLIAAMLVQWGIDPQMRGSEISREQRRRLRELLQSLRFQVRGLRPLAEAIITAGGVATNEVDPRTLASRHVAGLFLAGELLDIDAETGGYNLQAAFSTGWVAGRAAAEHVTARGSQT